MSSTLTLPGSPQHQALLQAVTSYYAEDPRILALGTYGSLARGTWDEFSDIDLEAVTAEDVKIDPVAEVKRLCPSFDALGERTLSVEPLYEDGATMILDSLMMVSVAYHPLAGTHPDVLDGFHLLMGRIGREEIVAAAKARTRSNGPDLQAGLQRYVRLAIRADIALQRRRLWLALVTLQDMRDLVFNAFALTRTDVGHGDLRPYHLFQAHADPALQARMGALLPRYSLRSVQQSLAAMLDLAEHGIETLSNGRIRLSGAHLEVIARVRRRQATLQFDD
jgi:hypothetical protein